MKIIVKDNTLINTDDGKSLETLTYTRIPTIEWADNPFKKSQQMGQALTLVESEYGLHTKVKSVERMLKELSPHVTETDIKTLEKRVNNINNSIEDFNANDISDLIFRKGKEPEPIEVSDLAAQYLAESSLAHRVATTNILTGVHNGNTPDNDNTQLVQEAFNETVDEINTLINDMADKLYELGIWEESDDEDEYNDEDW